MVNIGCVITTPGNTKNNKTGSWRTFKPVLDKEKWNIVKVKAIQDNKKRMPTTR